MAQYLPVQIRLYAQCPALLLAQQDKARQEILQVEDKEMPNSASTSVYTGAGTECDDRLDCSCPRTLVPHDQA